MKKIALVVLFPVFCMLLFGCSKEQATESTELPEALQDVATISGIKLSDGPVELMLDQTVDGTSLTGDALITNTTEINISIPGLNKTEYVEVCLHDSEHMDVIVATARLSDNKCNFTFSHLKSTVGYRISVESINLLESKSLKITD